MSPGHWAQARTGLPVEETHCGPPGDWFDGGREMRPTAYVKMSHSRNKLDEISLQGELQESVRVHGEGTRRKWRLLRIFSAGFFGRTRLRFRVADRLTGTCLLVLRVPVLNLVRRSRLPDALGLLTGRGAGLAAARSTAWTGGRSRAIRRGEAVQYFYEPSWRRSIRRSKAARSLVAHPTWCGTWSRVWTLAIRTTSASRRAGGPRSVCARSCCGTGAYVSEVLRRIAENSRAADGALVGSHGEEGRH